MLGLYGVFQQPHFPSSCRTQGVATACSEHTRSGSEARVQPETWLSAPRPALVPSSNSWGREQWAVAGPQGPWDGPGWAAPVLVFGRFRSRPQAWLFLLALPCQALSQGGASGQLSQNSVFLGGIQRTDLGHPDFSLVSILSPHAVSMLLLRWHQTRGWNCGCFWCWFFI